MNRNQLFKILLSACMIVFPALIGFSQKKPRELLARYEGGHMGVTLLYLYKDSTFRYKAIGDIGFIARKSKGHYSKTDTSLTLYTKKGFAFLRKRENKYWPETFRIVGNDVLMYSREQEQSKDSSFYKDYNTLTLVRHN